MADRFRLRGDIRTKNRNDIRVCLRELFPDAAIRENEIGFAVDAQMTGETAQELNRTLLSALRRVERRTTLRAEWTSAGTVERFFDYVHKGSRPIGAS